MMPAFVKALKDAQQRQAFEPPIGPPKPMVYTWRCPACDVRWRATEANNLCWNCEKVEGIKAWDFRPV